MGWWWGWKLQPLSVPQENPCIYPRVSAIHGNPYPGLRKLVIVQIHWSPAYYNVLYQFKLFGMGCDPWPLGRNFEFGMQLQHLWPGQIKVKFRKNQSKSSKKGKFSQIFTCHHWQTWMWPVTSTNFGVVKRVCDLWPPNNSNWYSSFFSSSCNFGR